MSRKQFPLDATFVYKLITKFSILAVFFVIHHSVGFAQPDSVTLNSYWNTGILELDDHSKLEGLINHDEKLRLIKFKLILNDSAAQVFPEREISAMEYYDTRLSKQRKFYALKIIDESSLSQGAVLYEVVMVMKDFAVLSRKFGVVPTSGATAKIEYDQVEKFFLAGDDTQAALLWLGPLIENHKSKPSGSQIEPFFAWDVIKNYTGARWSEVKSFVKKNRLDLERRPDLIKALAYYQQLEIQE